MALLLISLLIIIVCFGGVVLVGAPYLPTLTPQLETALKLANLKSGQTLLELGCGDGKVVIAAAKQGINVVGYELNPLLALIAWVRTRRYRKNVRIVWGNFWFKDWQEADAIFVFLLTRYMEKLDKKIGQYPHKPVRLVSFAFNIKGKQPIKIKDGIYVYDYRK